jgi:outer membrane protein
VIDPPVGSLYNQCTIKLAKVDAMCRKIIAGLLTWLFIFSCAPQTLAGEAEGLTIEQAVDMALGNSKTLKQAELEIEKVDAQRQPIADTVKFIPNEASGSPVADKAYTALVTADLSRLMTRKNRDITEDKITVATVNAYLGVLRAMNNLNYCKDALRHAQTEWRHATIKHQQGMLSAVEKNAADTKYQAAQTAVQSAEVQLATAYEALNKLLGLRAADRPVLSEKPAYSEINVSDLEGAVSQAVEGNPSVWLAEQNIDLAKLQLALFDFNSNQSYKASEIAVEQAELSAVDVKQQFRQAVRDIYYSIISLENSYILQQEAVKLAEDNLRVKKLMNSVGLATAYDVQTAELELQKAKTDLDAIVFQHEYQKMIFEKPWAI